MQIVIPAICRQSIFLTIEKILIKMNEMTQLNITRQCIVRMQTVTYNPDPGVRKSGIPAEQEMPAPATTKIRL